MHIKGCCCCCLVASVVSDSVWHQRRQPTRLCHPWDSPGKNTGVGCHCLLQCMKMKSESEVAQSCPTLSDPMDCSLPGSSVHGIFQARVLEWGAIAFSDIKGYLESIILFGKTIFCNQVSQISGDRMQFHTQRFTQALKSIFCLNPPFRDISIWHEAEAKEPTNLSKM